MRTISVSFDEAAKIDGASDLYILTKVLVPMTMPVIMTMVIFSFQGAWNQYLEPLIYIIDPSKWTLALAMASYKGTYATAWNLFMAADLIYILPMLLIFFFGQKYFMQGLGSLNSRIAEITRANRIGGGACRLDAMLKTYRTLGVILSKSFREVFL
ncbi:ABC transporter permease subunit [Paenibacillus sp. JTLBN-2024]